VSDGYRVVVSPTTVDLPLAPYERGFEYHPVDTSESLRFGGAKRCTLETRPASRD
jgi:N-dimethylarginine dimethylaminohydrolase